MVSVPMNTTSSAAIQKLNGSKTIAIVVEIRTSYTITYLTWHLSQTIEKSNHGTRAVDGNGRITLGKLGSTFEDLVLFNVKVSGTVLRQSSPITSQIQPTGQLRPISPEKRTRITFCNCATVAGNTPLERQWRRNKKPIE